MRIDATAPADGAPEADAHPRGRPPLPPGFEGIVRRPFVERPARLDVVDDAAREELVGTLYRGYWENGRLCAEGPFVDGEKTGEWREWSEDGRLILQGTYVDDRAEGSWMAWHSDGRLRLSAGAKAGRFHGECTFWRADGGLDVESTGRYVEGEKVE
jgi:hypothetical protein